MIEAWDTGAYRDVREIWERAEILGGENKFKGELIRGLHAFTGHLEYDIGQIRSAVSALSALHHPLDWPGYPSFSGSFVKRGITRLRARHGQG
jgi:hypothetical protein